ncbi:MAG: hypothetical protein EPN93_05755 [Spirochaetes bacterium]|nr:MAG: hypothetical protein EPN93_05755 [Spirochaetota bacterium]
MKIIRICAIIIIICATAAGAFAVPNEIQGRLGTAYATDPDKFGLDVSGQFNWVLDPYFALGFDAGFYWINWSRKIGTKTSGAATVDVKADTNAYDIPVMADAQLRLPVLKKYIYVTPYATIGLGYSFMLLTYSQPDFTTPAPESKHYNAESINKFFYGFTWQFLAGAGFQPEGSKIEFIGEVGYRGGALKSGSIEIDMGGYLFRLGVKYPFGK